MTPTILAGIHLLAAIPPLLVVIALAAWSVTFIGLIRELFRLFRTAPATPA